MEALPQVFEPVSVSTDRLSVAYRIHWPDKKTTGAP